MQHVQLGAYRLLKLLATGGMGEVFLARHEGPAGFAKTMVVKRMLAHLGRDPKFVEMFLNEARLAAQLSHPNIVQLFELGEQEGTYFMAMEFIHGVNLRSIKRRLEEQHLEAPADFGAWACAEALKGLHYAHTLTDEHGALLHIVHRDVSPDNVLVGFNGTVKMVDFGIAKASTSISTTNAGTVKGKFSYMAPELLHGQPADPRTDVYSMGVVLYEFLTGGRPFQGTSEAALVKSILEDAPRPLRELRPGIPAALEEIVHRAISKNPQERFQSAETMSAALECFLLVSGGMSQEGAKALLRGMFDQAALHPEVTPVEWASVEVSSGFTGPECGAQGPGPGSLPVTSPLPAGRGPRAVRPWLWGGVGVAMVVATVGLSLLAFSPPPMARMQLLAQAPPRPQQASAAALESALAPPTPVSVAAAPAANLAPLGPGTAVEPATTLAPEPLPTSSGTSKRVARRGAKGSKGTVVLRVNPATEVIHNGKKLGVTPMAPIRLPSGAQTLTLMNQRLDVEKKIRVVVPARGRVVVRVDLVGRM